MEKKKEKRKKCKKCDGDILKRVKANDRGT